MDVTSKKLEDTKLELTIKIEEKELAEVKKVTLKRLKKDIKAPGFRDGKVPDKVAEKHVDPAILQNELMQDAVNEAYVEAITKQKIRSIGNPHIEIKKFVSFTELEFTATVEVVPPIKLPDYKGFKFKREEIKVVAKDINDVLENLARQTAEKTEVKRACNDGDEVIINFSGTDKDGKAVPGAKGSDYPLVLGSQTFIPGFEEEVIGKKAGEDHEFTITFPKDYAHAPLANQEVTFKVHIKTVKELKSAKIDDELAKKAGDFKSVDELKKDIKKQLMTQKREESDNKLKNQIIEELLKKTKVKIPEIIINDQIQALRADFMNNLSYRGMTMQEYLEQIKQTQEEFEEKELKAQAVRRSEIGLILAEVADVEDITISDKELDMRLEVMRAQYQGTPQMLTQLDSDEARKDIGSRLLTEKTINKLVEYAT